MRNFIIVLSILFIAALGYTGADRIIQTQKLQVSEPAASGTNKITVTSPALSGDYTFTLPNTSGTSGYILATDGSGGLSWTNSLTSPIFSGTVIAPIISGGTGTTSTLTLKPTTGVGTTNADMIFQVGNNGATEAMRILNSGFVGIGTNSPGTKLTVKNDSDTPFRIERDSSSTGTVSSLKIYNGNTTTNNWTGMSFRGLDSGATEGVFSFIGSQMVSHTAGAVQGDLAFYTSSGNFSIAERMRITSAGLINVSGLTASRALVTDASKNLSSSATTATEVGYLSGVTAPTGTGALVLATSPTLVTPALGTPSSGTLTNATGLPLTTGVTGTLPIANGGTGQTTANNALNALLPSQGGNSGKVLGTDGTNTSWIANGATVAMGSGLTGGTIGSALFVGAGSTLAQDNSNFFWDDTNNRLGLGTASPGAKLVASNNSATPQTPVTSTVAHFAGADAAASILLIDGYGGGANPTVIGRRSAGTAATPTAAVANAQILNLSGRTFGTTAYQGENASIRLMASEAQTDSALGTYITMHTTANGGSTLTERMRIDNAGKVGIGRTPTTNTLEVNASASINGTTGVSLNLSGGTGTNYIYYDDNLSFNKNGTGNAFAVDANRNITFSNIHNNGTPPTNTTQTISSGTYTPTITNSTNVAASSNPTAIYSRVGNVVTVSGSLEIDPTSATTNTLIDISLPIASNFTGGSDGFGIATMAPINVDPADGWLTADATNDRMTLQMYPNLATNQEWRFQFQYVVK